MSNDLNEYWVTMRFANMDRESSNEFHVRGLLNALNKVRQILDLTDNLLDSSQNILVLELNIKVIQ